MNESRECPVCYDEISSTTNNCITSCGHAFCLSCMLKCIQTNNTCPCCRTSLIEKKKIEYDSDSDSNISNYDSESGMSSDYGDWLRSHRARREQREQQRREQREQHRREDDEISIWSDIDDDDYDDDDVVVDVDVVDVVVDVEMDMCVDMSDMSDNMSDYDYDYDYNYHDNYNDYEVSEPVIWEDSRRCEQQVDDINVEWLMTMCR